MDSNGVKRSILRISIVGCLLLWAAGQMFGQTAGEGTSFTLVLPYLAPSSNGGGEQIIILLASETGSSVTVRNSASGATRSVFVAANSTTELILDTADVALPYAEGVFQKSLLVRADRPVTAAVLLDRGTASEGYGAIADSLLGLEYRAVGNVSLGPGSFVVVAATEDRTTVQITPNRNTLDGDTAGEPLTINLNRGEVYQLLSEPRLSPEDNDDLTGTRVLADRPVAVWSGVTCGRLPIGNETCGPLIEQLPSVSMLGSRHPFSLYSGERLTYWKVVAGCADTRVFSTELLPEVDTVLTGVADQALYPTVENGEINLSEPGLLVHLGVNVSGAPPRYVDSAVGDPTMGLIVPVEQMARRHRVVVPRLASRVDGGRGIRWQHFLNIARSAPGDVRLNGNLVPFVGNHAMVSVTPGGYLVDGDVPVSVNVNGRSVSDAYAFVSSPVVRTWPLHADSITAELCGDVYETTVSVQNTTEVDLLVEEVEFLAGLQGELLSPALPFVVPAGDVRSIDLRFRNLQNGTADGSVVLRGGECRRRLARVPVKLFPDRLDIRGLSPDDEFVFPAIFPVDGFVEAPVVLHNPSSHPLRITGATIYPGRFSVISPALPLTIAPGAEVDLLLRFTPEEDDVTVVGKLIVHTGSCPDDSLFSADLRGEVKRLQTDVPGTLQYLCEPKEPDTLRVVLTNKGNTPLQLDEVVLDESDVGNEFLLINGGQVPLTLLPGDSVGFAVRFLPGQLGIREAGLRIIGSGIGFDTLRVPLRARNELALVVPDVQSIDLGTRLCDTETVDTVIIRNNGSVASGGIVLSMLGGDIARFAASVPDELQPGDSIVVLLSAGVEQYGRFRDTLRVFIPSCDLEYLIPVEGRCAVGRLEFAWGEEAGAPGDQVAIPLSVHAVPPLFAQDAEATITMQTRLHRDVFLPGEFARGELAGMTVQILSERVEGSSRVLEMELSGTLPSSGVLGTLNGLTLLGSVESTPVVIDSLSVRFHSDIYDAEIGKTDGELRIEGICFVGSARLVQTSGAFALLVAPNPVRDLVQVQMGLVEDGPTQLVLVNTAGKKVLTIIDGKVEKGQWDISFPVTDLPPGRYQLVLTTRTQMRASPLIILQ